MSFTSSIRLWFLPGVKGHLHIREGLNSILAAETSDFVFSLFSTLAYIKMESYKLQNFMV
jgi:hypothetical protein